MTVAQAILNPTARVVLLAEITAGVWCRAWVVDGTFTNTYKVSLGQEVTTVKWNLTTTLYQRTSVADVDANAGSWYWDGSLLWVRPVSGSIFDNVVQAFVGFWLSHPMPKVFNDRFYDPRLLSAPQLSQRIEAVFGDVAQVGGGTMNLANTDGYFDTMQDYQWNAGTVTLKLGIDTPAGDMAFADYQTMATWAITTHERNVSQFTLTLTEPKAKTKAKLPFTFFSRDTYANIDDDQIGKAIPIAYGRLYGLEPILVDPGAKQFKIASHAIREFSAVRLEQTIDEFHSRTVTAWNLYSSDTYRYYLAGEEVKSVTHGSTVLTRKDTVADCVATDATWASQENYVYVNPPAGQTITSATITVDSNKQVTGWQTANFATVDIANAMFTLGSDYTVGQGVSIDIIGKTSGGVFLENSIDIIQDMLTTVGETNLNATSFSTARALLKLGMDENNNEVFVRSVGLFINEATEVMEIIGKVLEAIGGYMYSDGTGQFTVGVFMPQPSDALQRLTDTDIIEFNELTDAEKIISKAQITWAPRKQDEFEQTEVRERIAAQYINGQPSPVVDEIASPLTAESAVEYFGDRKLLMEGTGIKRYDITTKWQGILLKPGTQLWVQSTARHIDQVMEVLEVNLDVGNMTVRLGLGNLRNLGHTPGFWVANGSSVLPTDFAAETGYAAGSLTWNAGWSDTILNWVRHNVGYWTDANGFATTTDADSFLTSTWV